MLSFTHVGFVFLEEKRRGKQFTTEILKIGLDYLRDGARYSMNRRLLQRNAILNDADRMSFVDAITIHNFKLRLAYYRWNTIHYDSSFVSFAAFFFSLRRTITYTLYCCCTPILIIYAFT